MKSVAIVLAAGVGERMKSKKHKVLHEILGVPLIDYLLKTANDAGIGRTVVVVGNRAEQVCGHLGNRVEYAVQNPALGWGTAKAAQAGIGIAEDGPAFVLLGDSPLLRAETLIEMREAVQGGAAAAIMTSVVENPTGYGRILRDEEGNVCGIVEEKDATPEQRELREINSAALCVDGELLRECLPLIGNNNAKGEYYLTDLTGILYARGGKIVTVRTEESDGVGVNTRAQLAQATALMRERINRCHMDAGVTLIDPARTDIGPDVTIGEDTVIHPNCMLMGKTQIGEDCVLLPGCRFENALLGDSVRVESSLLQDCTVGSGTTIGPFANLRPGSALGERCRIGDFVEIKNSNIGDLTRISHLTYVGDSDLGKDINLGCGVVFSNYDGKNKARSTIADHAFIGGNVNLVSPVSIGESAYIAAGTTVTEDVPANALAVGRAKPYIKEGWVEARKKAGKL